MSKFAASGMSPPHAQVARALWRPDANAKSGGGDDVAMLMKMISSSVTCTSECAGRWLDKYET